jgi:hypothetical protein
MLATNGQRAFALPGRDTTNDGATLDFPDAITFHVDISSPGSITSVVLEYGDDEQTCGEIVATAYPQTTPGRAVRAEWTWDMRQSGSLPPGATIWWRWRITDETGTETLTEGKTVTWLDSGHPWQMKSKGDIRLHWYLRDQSFAQDLLDNAYAGLARVERDAGLSTDQPIDLYIYANTKDMTDAVLYEPSWTGGQAFPLHNIVILGISQADLSWGRRAEVHELTHVLVGHLTFTCLGDVPTWLNEGLAVYSEGELEISSLTQLKGAIRSDTLLSVRSLSGGFSEVSDKASLSYSESYSIVKFLLETYGRNKMTALLVAMRDGNSADEALSAVYGFNTEGLDEAWRASIGGRRRAAASIPTSMPSPTTVPTIVPVSGVPLAIAPTPFSYPTAGPTQAASGTPPWSLTLMLVLTCCSVGGVVGVFVIGALLATQRRKKGKNEDLA